MGWVYAFVTPSMQGITRFGATESDPAVRLREANAPGTWTPPEPYVIAAATEVDDPFAVERGIHAILASRRIHPRREFFRFPTDEARALLALIPGVPRVPAELEDVDVAAIPEEATALAAAARRAEAPVEEHHGFRRRESARRRGARRAQVTVRELRETRSEEQIMHAPLRAWVESTYAHVPLREKDSGMKLGDLFCAYVMAGVHAYPVGKITFAAMLKSLYPGIGPYKNVQRTVSGLYLLREG
jgi:hypothetical protein